MPNNQFERDVAAERDREQRSRNSGAGSNSKPMGIGEIITGIFGLGVIGAVAAVFAPYFLSKPDGNYRSPESNSGEGSSAPAYASSPSAPSASVKVEPAVAVDYTKPEVTFQDFNGLAGLSDETVAGFLKLNTRTDAYRAGDYLRNNQTDGDFESIIFDIADISANENAVSNTTYSAAERQKLGEIADIFADVHARSELNQPLEKTRILYFTNTIDTVVSTLLTLTDNQLKYRAKVFTGEEIRVILNGTFAYIKEHPEDHRIKQVHNIFVAEFKKKEGFVSLATPQPSHVASQAEQKQLLKKIRENEKLMDKLNKQQRGR